MAVNLTSPEGLPITFSAAHFSDKGSLRQQQWEQFTELPSHFPFSEHAVMLADHNSVITPGEDFEVISVHDDLTPSARAHTTEVRGLAELCLRNA